MANNPLTRKMVEQYADCTNTRICLSLNVAGCRLDDISLCLQMPRLEVLWINSNMIRSLTCLRNCVRLREVHLHGNSVEDLDELSAFKRATELTILTVKDNPFVFAAGAEYRASVLRLLPQIKILDYVMVSQGELDAALRPVEAQSPTALVNEPELRGPQLAGSREHRGERERPQTNANDSDQSPTPSTSSPSAGQLPGAATSSIFSLSLARRLVEASATLSTRKELRSWYQLSSVIAQANTAVVAELEFSIESQPHPSRGSTVPPTQPGQVQEPDPGDPITATQLILPELDRGSLMYLSLALIDTIKKLSSLLSNLNQ